VKCAAVEHPLIRFRSSTPSEVIPVGSQEKGRDTDWPVLRIAIFPILADVVEVKTGSQSIAHWRIHFIGSNGWLRHSFAHLITLLDIDGIGQNWEGSNMWSFFDPAFPVGLPPRPSIRRTPFSPAFHLDG